MKSKKLLMAVVVGALIFLVLYKKSSIKNANSNIATPKMVNGPSATKNENKNNVGERPTAASRSTPSTHLAKDLYRQNQKQDNNGPVKIDPAKKMDLLKKQSVFQ